MLLETLLIIGIAFIIAALPLYFAVKVLGGKTTIFRTIGVNILSALVIMAVYWVFPWANIISLILLIWIYRHFFRVGWLRAFVVWLLQLAFTFLLALLATFIIGISFL